MKSQTVMRVANLPSIYRPFVYGRLKLTFITVDRKAKIVGFSVSHNNSYDMESKSISSVDKFKKSLCKKSFIQNNILSPV